MDDSNFIQLRECNPKLFNAINIAEQMYIDGYYHYIPTAIRSFCEGSLKLLLNRPTSDYSKKNEDKLADLCREFEQEYNRETRVIAAVNRIRKLGNVASHFHPTNWAEGDIKTLLKDAHDLYKLVLETVYDIENASKISFFQGYLPSVSKQEEKLRLLAAQQLNDELDNKLANINYENRSLNKKLAVFENEKLALSSEIEGLKEKQLKLQSRLAMQNQQTDVIESLQAEKSETLARIQELEESFHVYKNQIDSLKKERKYLLTKFEEVILNNVLVPTIHSNSKKSPVLDSFDETQTKMFSIMDGKHFLNAPPGAGKTTILTQRLKNALTSFPNDNQIACLTFTTRAAKEMKLRASNILEGRAPFIGNFHTFCLHQLRNSENNSLQFRRFSIIDEEFVALMMGLICDEFNGKLYEQKPPDYFTKLVEQYLRASQVEGHRVEKPRDVNKAILSVYIDMLALDLIEKPSVNSIAKQRLSNLMPNVVASVLNGIGKLTNQSFSKETIDADTLSHIIWSLHHAYRKFKFENKSMDFDDVLIFGLQELETLDKKLDFLQIDEVQDLSQYQWEIINAISDNQTHIFAVGDTYQSIYGFMGASVGLLNERLSSFNCHDLANNYRSTPDIINLLNAYRKSNFNLGPIESKTEALPEVATMLLATEDNLTEVSKIVSLIKRDMANPDRTICVLLSTNAATEVYSQAIGEAGINFFRVSKFDLMQRTEIADWLCLLRIFQHSDTSYDWWRLLYRICHSHQSNFRQKDAMSFIAKLDQIGVSPIDIISELSESRDQPEINEAPLLRYKLKEFINSYDNSGIVIFDTETTGLNFLTDKIIQLAAVKVNSEGVIDTFDKYIKLDLDSEEFLRAAFYESAKVHKITEANLANGETLEDVLADFFKFVGDFPLVAHNLAFDETMVRMNINNIENRDLLRQFDKLRNGILVDSLAVARKLFPNLQSHKLGDLLNEFNLEGVNSHNALDDVKATASLVNYMIDTLRARLEEIDSLVDSELFRSATYALSKHWSMIERLMRAKIADGDESELEDSLTFWIDYSYSNGMYNDNGNRDVIENEIEEKLIPFLKRNNYKGLFSHIMDESQERAETLYTLKESDLISDEHKVVISTVHRAKGLEFDTAIIPQVTNSNYPSWSPHDTSAEAIKKKEEESRRLLYVALSRPRNKLLVSYHKTYKPSPNSKGYEKAISPFLEDCIDEFSWTNLKK